MTYDSSLLSLFSSTCTTSASHHGHHSRPRGANLVCGHMLSDFDVRAHIQEASKRGAYVAPDCCGSAIPQSILERVQAKDNPGGLAMETATELPDPLSRDSGYCEIVTSTADSSHPTNALPTSDKSPALPQSPMRRTRHEAINIDLALAKEAFTSYRTKQKEELARVSLFECSQRKALSAYQYCSMQQLEAQSNIDKCERIEQVCIIRVNVIYVN